MPPGRDVGEGLIQSVPDDARIEDVVSRVLTSAEAHQLSTDIAELVWRRLIDR